MGNFCLLPLLCGDYSVPQEEILSKVTGKKASTHVFCVRPMFKCFYCVLHLGYSGKQIYTTGPRRPTFHEDFMASAFLWFDEDLLANILLVFLYVIQDGKNTNAR